MNGVPGASSLESATDFNNLACLCNPPPKLVRKDDAIVVSLSSRMSMSWLIGWLAVNLGQSEFGNRRSCFLLRVRHCCY